MMCVAKRLLQPGLGVRHGLTVLSFPCVHLHSVIWSLGKECVGSLRAYYLKRQEVAPQPTAYTSHPPRICASTTAWNVHLRFSASSHTRLRGP